MGVTFPGGSNICGYTICDQKCYYYEKNDFQKVKNFIGKNYSHGLKRILNAKRNQQQFLLRVSFSMTKTAKSFTGKNDPHGLKTCLKNKQLNWLWSYQEHLRLGVSNILG